MKNAFSIFVIFISVILFVGCGETDRTDIPTPTYTQTISPTASSTSTITTTSTIIPTKTPSPTVIPILVANFIHPVDLSIAPMYDAYDLDSTQGITVSNAGSKYNFQTNCDGSWMVPHTNDNHPGYDYGSGMCGADVSGTPVNGMAVDFSGTVFRIVEDGLWANFGPLLLPDGSISQVVIKYGHITPDVSLGQKIDSKIIVGYLNNTQEVEIQVLLIPATTNQTIDKLNGYISQHYEDSICDPRVIGLEPSLSYGPIQHP